jgi:hypothetical protein
LFERKSLALVEAKVAGDGTGTVEGLASTFGNVDSYGDTVERGAYLDTIPGFLVDGFVAWAHDWENPVATPTSAVETERGLYLTAAFHSDPAAQRARTIAAERLERGKSMGLSIGYEALEWEMRKVETPYRGPYGELTDMVRVLKKIKLFEVSLVTVPADESARVTGAKDQRFPDQATAALAAVRALVERSKSLADLRTKEGRVLSEANRDRLRSLLTALEAAGVDIQELLAATEPAPKGTDLSALYGEFLRTQARLNGVAVGGG